MARAKRIAITTIIGILTGLYCAGSLLFMAPPGIVPESWFMLTILFSRTLQGFFIGFADRVPGHWAIRGGGIGALMSLQLAIVPASHGNFSGAGLLVVAGILYGVIEDWAGTRFGGD